MLPSDIQFNSWLSWILFSREKLEKVAAKMDLVAESVARILSQNSKDQKQPVKIRMVPSVLCLTQYNSNQLRADWSEFGTACAPHSYALSLHVSPCDQEFCLRSSEGSTFFKMPAGNIFVTIGKQLQVTNYDFLGLLAPIWPAVDFVELISAFS